MSGPDTWEERINQPPMMPRWLAERCMRVLDKAAKQEAAAMKLAERPDCVEGARMSLGMCDLLRDDVAAVLAEWAGAPADPESPSDA